MSRHKSRGWRGQYDRVKRWHRLVQEIGKQRATATDTEQQHDFLYAFFQNCCHLREWLENSGAICGSGSTLIAARCLRRHFIGIELDPTYHALATRRIQVGAA